MHVVRLSALALLGAILGGLGPSAAEAGFILRDVRAREVLDPIGFYEAEFVLTGLPGTFINGSNVPAQRDFITIFDVPDLEGDVSKPFGWTGRNDLVPGGLPVGFDDPTLPNLTFSFIAGDPIRLPGGASELSLGTFSWQTFDVNPLTLLSEIRYAWQTSRLLADGSVIKETGFGIAPVTILGVIPEPASLAMTAAGLGLVAALAAGRRRRSGPRPPAA